MLNVRYKNPLAKTYQYEYAMYKALCELFRSTRCKSHSEETLGLYYADLVKTNEYGIPSDKRQRDVDNRCRELLERDVTGRLGIGAPWELDAKVSINKRQDGTHVFVFDCGTGGRFAVRLAMEGRKTRIQLKDLSIKEVGRIPKKGRKKEDASRAA